MVLLLLIKQGTLKMGYEEDDVKSQFNTALSYVEFLGKLFNFEDNFYAEGKYEEMFVVSKTIYGRIEHKLNQKETEEIKETIGEVNKLMSDSHHFRQRKQLRFYDRYLELISKLESFRNKLRRYADKYGLLMPKAGDPRSSMLS